MLSKFYKIIEKTKIISKLKKKRDKPSSDGSCTVPTSDRSLTFAKLHGKEKWKR